MATKTEELAQECKRQYESCLYTSTTLRIWLRWLMWIRRLFAAGSAIAGSVAGWKLLTGTDLPSIKLITVISAFLAGLLPVVYAALKFDDELGQVKHLAGEFTNLRDRFRQAAHIASQNSYPEFEAEVKPLLERMERARVAGATPPELCFRLARRKIKAGHYDFDVDDGTGQTATPKV